MGMLWRFFFFLNKYPIVYTDCIFYNTSWNYIIGIVGHTENVPALANHYDEFDIILKYNKILNNYIYL